VSKLVLLERQSTVDITEGAL